MPTSTENIRSHATYSQDLPDRTPNDTTTDAELLHHIDLTLALLGHPTRRNADKEYLTRVSPLIRSYRQKRLDVEKLLCSADKRIQTFIDAYLQAVSPPPQAQLPGMTFCLDRPGLARILSLPLTRDIFSSPYLRSYRVSQGILHNPKSDVRTTRGAFHIVEGGSPVAADKPIVPLRTFGLLLAAALNPPSELLTLPLSADQDEPINLFVSLLLRLIVCPATGRDPQKTMEVRFFAPGSLVSNLDFVERIFGNAGGPYLPENDSALDVMHWTGHSGCVILAPHLVALEKRAVGLPDEENASERERKDGMFWRTPGDLYNDGKPFKVACRDERGVMVTIIADNYYGHCKKEVKTQISYAANLYGLCEEEHAGGAIAFATYVLGQEFDPANAASLEKAQFGDAKALLGPLAELRPEGYAIDRRFPDILYVPEDSEFSVREGRVRWTHEGRRRQLDLRADKIYLLPNGFRVSMEKQSGGAWRLVGARPRGTLCHKPCTVSGGGKSEISKSIEDLILEAPAYVMDFHRDMAAVAELLKKSFANIDREPKTGSRSDRPILSSARTMGSVIRLFTPSAEYTDEHNAWIRNVPHDIRELLFTVKRYYRPEWGEDWLQHFSVDRVNGVQGHELKLENQKLINNYLRVGYDNDGPWRIYKLRPDFHPAYKVQVEDDVTASVVIRCEDLPESLPNESRQSVKIVANCESFLFQRPDDAIHRGADKQAEADIAFPGTFLCNFEPVFPDQAAGIVAHVAEFDKFSRPMKDLLRTFTENLPTSCVVSSAHPRLVNGTASKNPRYLQMRSDLSDSRSNYLAELSARLDRKIPADRPVLFPVDATLAGRCNNPPDPRIGLPPLAVYSPIHYQELPELFMEFISSLTGKSPSTTGFGSEGALTKGAFNALCPVIDLNNAIVAAVLTGTAGFTTSAGYVGPKMRVDHDISMLVPEIWCRMRAHERDPKYMIEQGLLEPLSDFDFNGRKVLASRLGYRITSLFVERFLGRIFETPDAVFTPEMLRPETQSAELFATGVDAIVDAHRSVGQQYFDDRSMKDACPPLNALLHIMVDGSCNGMALEDPRVRQLFDRDAMLQSSWYYGRLEAKQLSDKNLWARHLAALKHFSNSRTSTSDACEFDLDARTQYAQQQLERVSSPSYISQLRGTIGMDPCSTRPLGSGSHSGLGL